MARHPRLCVPGYPLHAAIRGNDRRSVFITDGDRVFFHRHLVESARKYGCRIHAYVFMTNHVHLLVSGEERTSVGRMVQSLGRVYVRHFNTVHGRTGTLWEGRFRSSLVDSDAYLLACHRYIELNPVRACLVSRPADFVWSSHRYYVEGMPDDAVTPHSIWQEFGATPEARREAFAALFRVQLEEDVVRAIRDSLHHGWALGSPLFRKRMAEALGCRTERIKAGRPAGGRNRKEMESDPHLFPEIRL